jgi:hypothetical protein
MLDHIMYLITIGLVLMYSGRWLFCSCNFFQSVIIQCDWVSTLSEFQWESYLKECTDIDIMSSSFTQKYLEIISRNIPSKMFQVRPSDKPWFNSHIKREIRTGNRLKKIARTKRSSTAHFFGVSLPIHLHLKGTVHGHAWSYYLPYYDGICTYV